MWTFETETIEVEKIIRYTLYQAEKPLSGEEVLKLLQESADFRLFFNEALSSSPFQAFFWEVPPLSQALVTEPFEFVLIDSPVLAKVKSDPRPFLEHFKRLQEVTVFPNLGGDARLVVPGPIDTPECYTHLAVFSRLAPASQIQALWKTMAEVYTNALTSGPKWLSTNGLGVFWLHIRIDSRPKYYNYQPYRMWG